MSYGMQCTVFRVPILAIAPIFESTQLDVDIALHPHCQHAHMISHTHLQSHRARTRSQHCGYSVKLSLIQAQDRLAYLHYQASMVLASESDDIQTLYTLADAYNLRTISLRVLAE